MNYEEILLNYAKYFQQSDVVESAIPDCGWKLILLLRGLCDAMSICLGSGISRP